MGDRGNIVVQEQDEAHRVYLYTHWTGSEVEQVARAALASEAGRSRWGDAPYLARIVFDHMKGDDTTGAVGFGIGARLCDNEHPIVVIDVRDQIVWLEGKDGEPACGPLTFMAFAAGVAFPPR